MPTTQARHRELRGRFIAHLSRNAVIVGGGMLASLAVGMIGYRVLAPMSWVDAFLNAAMLLGGMGPVDTLTNDAAKIFAGVYAIYCGVVFIASAGLLIAPLGQHVLHRFHLDRGE